MNKDNWRVRESGKAEVLNRDLNLCVCTHLPLEDHTGAVDRIVSLAKNVSMNNVNVYLINRSLKKSLFSIFVDNDKYYQIKNGKTSEAAFPLRLRLLFPGSIKLAQEIFNRVVSKITFSVLSEVCLAYLLDPYLIVKLFFVCRKEKIDLIQCEFPITGLSCFAAKKLLKIPLVYDSHNVETERMRSMANVSSIYVAITKLIEKNCCMISDSIFVVSETDKKQYATWGISACKMGSIPNSVNVQEFSPATSGVEIREQYNLGNKTVLVFHGDLIYPPNREACLILAKNVLPEVLKTYPNAVLLLVGRDPPKNLNPNIVTTGFVKDLPKHIAAADLAVVPLLKGGGTRIKILEYMSCGKAVVSTTKGAEGLDLKNGQDILMVDYPNSEFVNLILKLFENPDLRRKVGLNAREKAVLFYDWEKNAQKAVQIYRGLVSEY